MELPLETGVPVASAAPDMARVHGCPMLLPAACTTVLDPRLMSASGKLPHSCLLLLKSLQQHSKEAQCHQGFNLTDAEQHLMTLSEPCTSHVHSRAASALLVLQVLPEGVSLWQLLAAAQFAYRDWRLTGACQPAGTEPCRPRPLMSLQSVKPQQQRLISHGAKLLQVLNHEPQACTSALPRRAAYTCITWC